jgi:hypothetical protein
VSRAGVFALAHGGKKGGGVRNNRMAAQRSLFFICCFCPCVIQTIGDDMSHLTIRLKLRIIFIALTSVFVLFGLLSLNRLGELDARLSEIEHDALPSILSSNSMNTELSDFRAKEGLHALTQDLPNMDAIEKALAFHQGEIEKARKILEPLIITSKGKALYADFSVNYAKYLEEHKKFIPISRRDETDAAHKQLIAMEPIFDKLSANLDALVVLKRERVNDLYGGISGSVMCIWLRYSVGANSFSVD